jgi:hypothetical protein
MKSTPLAPAPALFAFAGCLLLLREAVFFVGFYILGSSINWPQSLGLPAAETFRLITAHPGAVFSGYYVYLLSSLLFVPIALVLRALLRGENAVTDVVLDVAAALAVLSVAFRALGILRWLFAMPTLAKTYFDPVWLIALGVHLLRRARAAAPRPANA